MPHHTQGEYEPNLLKIIKTQQLDSAFQMALLWEFNARQGDLKVTVDTIKFIIHIPGASHFVQ